MTALKLLLVDDSADDGELLLRVLRKGGFEVQSTRVDTEAGLRGALQLPGWDLVVSDHSMPGFSGMRALEVFQELERGIPFIFVSADPGEEKAVEAMRLGVSDYHLKGKLDRLPQAIRRELSKADDHRGRQAAEAALLRSERQLQQSQKMEALGRLAGGVAHDFNNLLTVILGHLEGIGESGALVGEQRDSLQEIQACAERAAGLTRQLLALSRRQDLQRTNMDLNAVVADTVGMLRRIIGEDVQLALHLGESLPAVCGDPGQMQQVLMNLVVNARDAMPTGGLLTVATALVQLDADDLAGSEGAKPGSYLQLAVRDTGQGMDGDVLSHIFEPFFTTKAVGQGTGLGLAILYGIIRQSGGHLGVESAPGQGSCFKIYLPASAEPAAHARATPPRPTANALRGTETVLLVEDEQGVRDLLRKQLLRFGYTVLEAALPEEAISLVAAAGRSFHLLLTDVTMPQMDGRTMAKQVLAMRPEVKVLYMSGFARPEVLEGIASDGSCFLPKPFTTQALLEKMRFVLEGQGA